MNEIWTVEEEAARLRARFAGVAKAAFARDHGVPGGPSMLSQHLSAHRPLNLEAATAYAAGFGVPLAEISPRLALKVAAAAAVNSVDGEANVAAAPASMKPRRYPVISSVQAGEWAEIVDNFQPGDADSWQDSPVDLGENGFALKIEGDSMTNPAGGRDNFPDGIYVHIHPGIEAQPGDYVVAKREQENKATFKKLVRVDGEQYLHAINPAWPKPYIKLEPGDRIIGKLKFAGWSF